MDTFLRLQKSLSLKNLSISNPSINFNLWRHYHIFQKSAKLEITKTNGKKTKWFSSETHLWETFESTFIYGTVTINIFLISTSDIILEQWKNRDENKNDRENVEKWKKKLNDSNFL